MDLNWPRCVDFVLDAEGGWVDDPKDPGGATNRGITQATYDLWRQREGLGKQSVRLVTTVEAQGIYKIQFWNPIQGPALPLGIDLMVFDYGVNSGPRRAIMDLQRCLGVSADGVLGLHSMAALQAIADLPGLVAKLGGRRLRYLKGLKTWPRFGVGWGKRIAACQTLAIQMATGK